MTIRCFICCVNSSNGLAVEYASDCLKNNTILKLRFVIMEWQLFILFTIMLTMKTSLKRPPLKVTEHLCVFANPKLMNNREIVSTAVTQNSDSLQDASDEF